MLRTAQYQHYKLAGEHVAQYAADRFNALHLSVYARYMEKVGYEYYFIVME